MARRDPVGPAPREQRPGLAVVNARRHTIALARDTWSRMWRMTGTRTTGIKTRSNQSAELGQNRVREWTAGCMSWRLGEGPRRDARGFGMLRIVASTVTTEPALNSPTRR